ncbi:LysR family transcriptional regulator [Clostridium sp. AF18-27]|uniref:LysR family transcriptional regulator n=1 Tax=Enterocloster lavalensis TaxID=460384 RepID=UPI000E4FEFB0|nr:LysR family transcriptional regulator [Enterocloster lavalensis]MCB6342932.1 LysR family transcriptional regulator [Enterocloster lavalensis]RHR51325.1 LysR family transcriptional regulator [Clostridium sp. AF18-27]
MNLSYLKYAVEVEKTGSITKAAQNFYMNQPHLSKIIRELERDLGCPIFDRTSRGMVPTKRGEEFLRYAKAILVQEEQIEALCQQDMGRTLTVSLAAPRASYISYGFASFMRQMTDYPTMKVDYRETNSRDIIRGVSGKTFDLGIVRFQSLYVPYYQKMLQDENLESQDLWEFSCNLLMSASHPLAERDDLTYLDLSDYVELVQGDTKAPSFSFEPEDSPSVSGSSRKIISIYDRGSQLELLRQLPGAFMWTSPVPYDLLNSLALIQKPCTYPGNLHKDILVYRSGYRMSREEKELVNCLRRLVSQLS